MSNKGYLTCKYCFIKVDTESEPFNGSAQTDGVQQPERDVIAAEGGNATLNCLYNTSASNHYLYWYRLEGGSSPTFILSRFKVGEGKTAEKRFSSSLDATARSVPLTIQDLRPSDSAVYYCALSASYQMDSDHSCLIRVSVVAAANH
uniref:Ig-like domain-containing protein n=1 Tax=Poecilia reticulata TaxID=8081 RepID=A0A3P9Q1T7_POERE